MIHQAYGLIFIHGHTDLPIGPAPLGDELPAPGHLADAAAFFRPGHGPTPPFLTYVNNIITPMAPVFNRFLSLLWPLVMFFEGPRYNIGDLFLHRPLIFRLASLFYKIF